MDLRAKSQSASVITDAPTKDGVSASWDHHELLLVAQRGNAFTKIDLRRRRSPRTLSTGEGDEVGRGPAAHAPALTPTRWPCVIAAACRVARAPPLQQGA
jgi:hypothetical protein